MRISWNNLLKKASLSATNENLNSPVENILDNILELYFLADSTGSTITATLLSVSDIDHVAYGYHNLSAMQIKFYDIGDSLITTVNVTIEADRGFYYFTKVTGVAKIEFLLTSLDPELFLGGLSVGEYLEMPLFRNGPSGNLNINDSVIESSSGQTAGNQKGIIDSIALNFAVVSPAQEAIIETMILTLGTVKTHFIDIWPDNHIRVKPWFARMSNIPIPKNKRLISDFYYDIVIEYRKMR
jgi:hypothetical protein